MKRLRELIANIITAAALAAGSLGAAPGGLLPALSVVASADSGNCGTEGHESDVTWTLEGDTLTISGTGAIKDYNYGYQTAGLSPFNYNNSIKTIVIEDGVTHIGNSFFYYCYNVTSVTIPDNVESIGE